MANVRETPRPILTILQGNHGWLSFDQSLETRAGVGFQTLCKAQEHDVHMMGRV